MGTYLLNGLWANVKHNESIFTNARFILISGNVSFRRTTNAQNVRKYILPKRPSHTRLASPHDNDHPSNTHLKPPDSDNRILTSKPQHQSVIILTYMRSGSSLLGDIIQHSPGAFYLYEPLHSLGRVYTHFQTNLTFVNGTVRYIYSLHVFIREIYTTLHPSLFCETKIYTLDI